MIELSKQERERMVAYLEESAASEEKLIEQVAKLTGMEPIVKHKRIEVSALRIAAHYVGSWMVESIE